MKILEKEKARKLRMEGISIIRIAELLNVSKASVSTWVRDIELSKDQIESLRKLSYRVDAQIKAAQKMSSKCRNLRQEYQNEGKLAATQHNQEHAIGCSLYWAEGTKSINKCIFTNSNKYMMQTFLNFIRKTFHTLNDDISVTLNVYVDNNLSIEEIEKFWLNTLNLSDTCLRKHTIKKLSIDNGKKNKHPYGVCTLSIKKSVKIVQHIYGAIKEYNNIKDDFYLG